MSCTHIGCPLDHARPSTLSRVSGSCDGSSDSIRVKVGLPQRSRTVSARVPGISARCTPPDQPSMPHSVMISSVITRSGSVCSRMIEAISLSICSSICCWRSRVMLRPTPR